MSSTYTGKNNPFSRCTKRHSQFGIFSQPYSIGSSQIAFPIIVLPKDDHNRFRSRGMTGSSILDHDLGHLCFGRRIQMSGHSDFGNFTQFVCIFHFDLGISRYCVCCLSIRNLAFLEMISMIFGGCQFEMLMILVL